MSWDFQTIIEPFRIKSVEAIPILSRTEREVALEAAAHNLFKLPAAAVTIDLLTDSGTGAMSSAQWAALMTGDESYAGSNSYFALQKVVERLTGFTDVFPCHQGRAAERILSRTVIEPGQIILNNTHFDTTRANFEAVGAEAVDLPVPPGGDFAGNMDLDALDAALTTDAGRAARRVAMVMVTITNNAVGGQPVSMANLRAVRQRCDDFGVPLYLDAARFAENAWFIKQREPGFGDVALEDIVRQMFAVADGFTMSAKKDGIVNIGGLLAVRDPEWHQAMKNELILTEGFPTYGGLAGRDLEALSVGLLEALDEDYLHYRTRSIAYFSERLIEVGVPVIMPPGGHAVYIDAKKMLPHIPPEQFPGVALINALYIEGGVRAVELGSLMFPGSPRELVRMAMPRRVYTQAHVDYVIEVAGRVAKRAAALPGYEIVKAPAALRHFSAVLAPHREI
ncbi:MAG: tryptophanase [Myxococcales bacterium]|nr:tryptophanase [Myxococcales bacterium]